MLRLALLLPLALPAVHAWGFCNDENESCANWAAAGECEKDHVKKMCPHSCSVCPHICRDADESCAAWADNGQCEKNMDYMLQNCPVACGACKTKCYDKDPQCPSWARSGECKKNSGLLTECPVSCGVCTNLCLDKQNDCPNWAASGACGTNPAYMLKECPRSCSVCSDDTHSKAAHPTTELTDTKACADTDRHQCLIWGEQECAQNPASVMKLCPDMCGLCTLACEDKYKDCPNWKEGKANVFGNKSGKGCDENADFMKLNCPYSCGVCPRLHVFPSKDKTEL